MKTFKKILIVAVATLIGVSCTKLEDLNVDPTKSIVADAPSQIAAVQLRYSGNREIEWRSTMGTHMAFTQIINGGWAVAQGGVYQKIPSYYEVYWKSAYRDINDLQIAINSAEKIDAYKNYVAVGKIMKTLIFSQLTDSYGDIPYFEAVRGYDEGIIHPKYDKQEDIYADFFKELKIADSLLSSDNELKGDMIYKGDITKWKKFANSLRLRLAMRLVNVNSDMAEEEAISAVNAGVMNNVEDIAYVEHGNNDVLNGSDIVEIRGNGISQVLNFNDETVIAGATYVNYMHKTNDPRLTMIFGLYGGYKGDVKVRQDVKSTNDKSVDVTQEFIDKYGISELSGFPPGYFLWELGATDNGFPKNDPVLTKNDKDIDFVEMRFRGLQFRRELTRFDLPSIYMSYAEVELFKAEMASRGWTATGITSAKDHFKTAVEASFYELENIIRTDKKYYGDIDDFIDNTWASSSEELEVINMQHYINNIFNGREAFSNWRRSGYPLLVPAKHDKTDPDLNGLIPRRIPYPNSEIQYNKENIKDHLDNGVNFWGAPVWWDGDKTRGVSI